MNSIKYTPENIEAHFSEAIIARDDSLEILSVQPGLGPPDLCWLQKSCRTGLSVLYPEAKGYYHWTLGADVTSSASVAAYFVSICNKAVNGPSGWGASIQGLLAQVGLSSSEMTVERGFFCTFDPFSRLDVRCELKVPGGVQCAVKSPTGTLGSVSAEIWRNLTVASFLRRELYDSDLLRLSFVAPAVKRLSPVASPEAERNLLDAIQEMYECGLFPAALEAIVPDQKHGGGCSVEHGDIVLATLLSYWGRRQRWTAAASFFNGLSAAYPAAKVYEVAALKEAHHIERFRPVLGSPPSPHDLPPFPSPLPITDNGGFKPCERVTEATEEGSAPIEPQSVSVGKSQEDPNITSPLQAPAESRLPLTPSPLADEPSPAPNSTAASSSPSSWWISERLMALVFGEEGGSSREPAKEADSEKEAMGGKREEKAMKEEADNVGETQKQSTSTGLNSQDDLSEDVAADKLSSSPKRKEIKSETNWAIDYISQALEKSPDDVHLMLALAAEYVAISDAESGMDILQKVLGPSISAIAAAIPSIATTVTESYTKPVGGNPKLDDQNTPGQLNASIASQDKTAQTTNDSSPSPPTISTSPPLIDVVELRVGWLLLARCHVLLKRYDLALIVLNAMPPPPPLFVPSPAAEQDATLVISPPEPLSSTNPDPALYDVDLEESLQIIQEIDLVCSGGGRPSLPAALLMSWDAGYASAAVGHPGESISGSGSIIVATDAAPGRVTRAVLTAVYGILQDLVGTLGWDEFLALRNRIFFLHNDTVFSASEATEAAKVGGEGVAEGVEGEGGRRGAWMVVQDRYSSRFFAPATPLTGSFRQGSPVAESSYFASFFPSYPSSHVSSSQVSSPATQSAVIAPASEASSQGVEGEAHPTTTPPEAAEPNPPIVASCTASSAAVVERGDQAKEEGVNYHVIRDFIEDGSEEEEEEEGKGGRMQGEQGSKGGKEGKRNEEEEKIDISEEEEGSSEEADDFERVAHASNAALLSSACRTHLPVSDISSASRLSLAANDPFPAPPVSSPTLPLLSSSSPHSSPDPPHLSLPDSPSSPTVSLWTDRFAAVFGESIPNATFDSSSTPSPAASLKRANGKEGEIDLSHTQKKSNIPLASKRLCARWLDDLVVALWRDLQTFFNWKAFDDSLAAAGYPSHAEIVSNVFSLPASLSPSPSASPRPAFSSSPLPSGAVTLPPPSTLPHPLPEVFSPAPALASSAPATSSSDPPTLSDPQALLMGRLPSVHGQPILPLLSTPVWVQRGLLAERLFQFRDAFFAYRAALFAPPGAFRPDGTIIGRPLPNSRAVAPTSLISLYGILRLGPTLNFHTTALEAAETLLSWHEARMPEGASSSAVAATSDPHGSVGATGVLGLLKLAERLGKVGKIQEVEKTEEENQRENIDQPKTSNPALETSDLQGPTKEKLKPLINSVKEALVGVKGVAGILTPSPLNANLNKSNHHHNGYNNASSKTSPPPALVPTPASLNKRLLVAPAVVVAAACQSAMALGIAEFEKAAARVFETQGLPSVPLIKKRRDGNSGKGNLGLTRTSGNVNEEENAGEDKGESDTQMSGAIDNSEVTTNDVVGKVGDLEGWEEGESNKKKEGYSSLHSAETAVSNNYRDQNDSVIGNLKGRSKIHPAIARTLLENELIWGLALPV